jgi:TonB family protein
LSDCRKFDEFLWLYPDIPESDKDELNRHIATCVYCRRALETIKALKNSAERDREQLAEIDSAAFDAAVMRKIADLKKPAAVKEKAADRYVLRLAFSFALAAGVVLFLVKSISDLSEIRTPTTIAQKEEADRYGVINIELGKQPEQAATPPQSQSSATDKKAPPALAEAPKEKEKALSKAEGNSVVLLPPPQPTADTLPILSMKQPPETTAVSGGEPQVAMVPSDTEARRPDTSGITVAVAPPPSAPGALSTLPKSLAADNAAPFRGGKDHRSLGISFASKATGGFSILPTPLASQAPDSVNIDAIYVTSENIAVDKQTSAASIAEIYKDTGSVQVQMPQSSILVTVEKMPQPLKMVLPEYPVWARKQELSGTLWVRARVESDGHVSEARITSCDTKGVGFEEAALKAAKESVFTPASSNGINLPVWIVYPVQFIYKQ